MRAAANTPVEPLGAGFARFPSDVGLPRFDVRVGLHITVFGACSAFTTRCRPHARRVTKVTLYIEGFSRFVTSTTAPITTGWSESCRVGLPPTEKSRLYTAHVEDRYDSQIYPPDWHRWRDPEVPEWFDPAGWLLDRHRDTPIADKPAIVCNDETITYSQLIDRVARYATALAGVGLASESRLLLFGTDSLDYVTVWLAAIRLGAVPVVISDLYKAKDLAYFLADTAVRLLFIDEEQLPKLFDIAGELPSSLTTILVRGQISADLATHVAPRSVIALQSALSAPSPEIAPYNRHANDLAYMFYSGGTTGTAKGIVHLAHDFVLIPERQGHFWEYSADDVVFATSKKYFTHGLWPGVLIPLYWGATVVLDRRPAALERLGAVGDPLIGYFRAAY
jgi:hypothetical protein